MGSTRYYDQARTSVPLLCIYLNIIDEKLFETIGECVTGLLVGAVTNIRHEILTFEPSSHPVIDTLRLPPVTLVNNNYVRSMCA